MRELQEIVDSLARELDRAVAVDDREMRLLTYSSHTGPVDEVRATSIVQRRAPEAARAWIDAHGLESQQGPLRVPANAELGMDARIIAPIRCSGMFLGYLALVEADPPLDDASLVTVARAADAVGAVLYREHLVEEIELSRERELLRDVLSPDHAVAEHAASELVEADLFVPATPVVAIAARPVHADATEPDENIRLTMSSALDRVRRGLTPGYRLQLVRADHCVFLAAPADPAFPEEGPAWFARELHGALAAALDGEPDWTVYVGIGDEQEGIELARASYVQALQALRAAELVPSFGRVVAYPELGVYRMLSDFPLDELTVDDLHPGLVALFNARNPDSLVATLECYLDLGCDAKAAAVQLELHRASLYYRLHKIEEIAGVSLRDGDDRLALHLGLKLARLTGVFPPRARTIPDA